ncbi:hypothetical protein [Amycolatopsis sp. NPDC004079]|uniref:hypothetical protein n=1 Tax=Amycolatopsis sp. NPDC004079 TaxID=3154549 RepID=UPI0033AADC0A
MNLIALTPQERRSFAAHLASAIHAPSREILLPFSLDEAAALADLLDLLALRPADPVDEFDTRTIADKAAATLAGRVRERVAQAQRAAAG